MSAEERCSTTGRTGRRQKQMMMVFEKITIIHTVGILIRLSEHHIDKYITIRKYPV